ncbi:MAG TPA: hypothetical protein VFX43_10800 [Chitinophagaceae bacterium]|nr:hypothetical protein [Chitinophagaceae bacterium]
MEGIKDIFCVLLALSSLGGCAGPSGSSKESQTKKIIKNVVLPSAYDFLRVYHTTVNDTVYADTTLLKLKTGTAGRISGIYRWVLPGKDGRYGKVSGTFSQDTVNGHFQYRQEGGSYTDSIQIILQAEKAVVIQFGESGYRLTDTLETRKH